MKYLKPWKPTACHQWENKLAASHPDDLSPDERAALQEHVRSCPACASLSTAYASMDAALRNLPLIEPKRPLSSELLYQQVNNKKRSVAADVDVDAKSGRSLIFSDAFFRKRRPKLAMTRMIRMANALAAVLVVGVILGGFVWLLGGHRNTSVGSGQLTPPMGIVPTHTANPATERQNMYDQITMDMPILNDPLTTADNYAWDSGNTCFFRGKVYHSKASVGTLNTCYAGATNFGDFLYQVQVTITSGNNGGILFRADNTNQKAYQFRINTDGTYMLSVASLDSQQNFNLKPLLSGFSPAIKQGLNQPNLVAVLAQGSNIYLYVNKRYIAGTDDSSYTRGQFGVYTDSNTGVVEATFSAAQVWRWHLTLSPQIAMTPSSLDQNSCSPNSDGTYNCIVTVTETSSGTVNWSASSDLGITLPGGPLTPSQPQQQVMISNIPCQNGTFIFTGQGSNAVQVSWSCTPPPPQITVQPGSLDQSNCSPNSDGTYNCTVTVAAASGTVSWSVSSDLGGTTFSPTSGTLLLAGQQQVTISNIPCQNGTFAFTGQGSNAVAVPWSCTSPPPPAPCITVDHSSISLDQLSHSSQTVVFTNCGQQAGMVSILINDTSLGWLSASPASVTLGPGGTVSVTITGNFSACASCPSGSTYTGMVMATITTLGGSMSATVNVSFTIPIG